MIDNAIIKQMIHSCIKILQKLNVYYTKSVMDSGNMFQMLRMSQSCVCVYKRQS